jgi:hypothetical protein
MGTVMARLSIGLAATCLTGMLGTPALAQHPQAIVDRAEADFAAGRIAESVAGFDRLAALDPAAAPWMWQRGIGLYLLGRFDECTAQFVAYRGVNPADIESAVWQFACVAAGRSVDEARAVLATAGPDPRVMRAEILEMFRGRLAPGVVVGRAAFIAEEALFLAHFYAGLYSEATGDAEAAAAHFASAGSPRFEGMGGFMNVVARVWGPETGARRSE